MARGIKKLMVIARNATSKVIPRRFEKCANTALSL
jgi:hypothetical protein